MFFRFALQFSLRRCAELAAKNWISNSNPQASLILFGCTELPSVESGNRDHLDSSTETTSRMAPSLLLYVVAARGGVFPVRRFSAAATSISLLISAPSRIIRPVM